MSTSEPATPIDEETARHLVAAYDEAAAPQSDIGSADTMADADLLRAYHRTDGEPGNSEVDALLAEIERRNLDL